MFTGRWAVRERPVEIWRRTLLETFDWRLAALGRMWHQAGRTGCLVWEGRDERRAVRVRVASAPSLAEELPEGAPWSKLAATVRPRRLLERLVLVQRRRRLDLLDAEEKVVARLALVEATAISPVDRSEREIGPWIEVEELRGYPDGSRVAVLLAKTSAFRPLAGDGFDLALAELGLRSGVDPSSFAPEFSRLANARVATSDALALLFEIVRVNEPGVRADLDVEFLHDYRVAVRRSRALVSELGHVFEKRALKPWRDELGWLGRVSGPVRDLDVLLDEWNRVVAGVASDARMEELRLAAKARRGQAFDALVAALATARYHRIVERWPAFLQAQRQALEPAVGTIDAEVERRVWRRYRRVVKRGRALDANSPAADFHRVRIQAKKLRYLLEVFRSLWSGDDVRAAIKALKKFQDRLGEFNDAEVHAELVRELAGEGALSPAAMLAAGELIEALRQRAREARDGFFELFESFTTDENAALYARLAGRERD